MPKVFNSFFFTFLHFWSKFWLEGNSVSVKNVLLLDDTRVRLNSDGVLRVFGKNGGHLCPKNTHGLSADKRSIMFWGPSDQVAGTCWLNVQQLLTVLDILRF